MAANRGKEVIVLDLGSCYSKVGFAGEGAPRKIVSLPIPTSAGARNGRAELAPARSYEEQMEAAIRKLLLRELMSSPKDKKVLVAEDLFAPAQTRETVLRILLEKLKASTVLLIPSPVLALYASGLEGDVSGLVVLSGYSETTVLPISNRLPLIYSSISSTELGSEMLHASMLQLAQDGEVGFSSSVRMLLPLAFHLVSVLGLCHINNFSVARTVAISVTKLPSVGSSGRLFHCSHTCPSEMISVASEDLALLRIAGFPGLG